MADTTDVRDWLKAQGAPVKDRGRIPAELRARYEAAHDDGPGADVVELPGAYDGGVSPLDFIAAGPAPTSDDLDGAELDGAELEREPAEPAAAAAQQPAEERRPRRVATAKRPRRSFSERIWGGPGGTAAKAPAKQHKRMPLTGLAEDLFLDLAWTFQQIPPMEKILYLQAPLAGEVVESSFKGTMVDRVLQPVARADRQFKAFESLTAVGWVFAIVTRGRRDESGEYSPETKLMFSGLRHSLLSMSRLAQVDFDELKRKSEDLRSASGQIDKMIAWIFDVPGMTDEQRQAMEEQQAGAAAAAAAGSG